MTQQTKTYYAIVPSRGCYGQSSTVRAVKVCRNKNDAMRWASVFTTEYRRGMARYGGSSGGYRVVKTDKPRRDLTYWLGLDLDAEKGVE